MTKWFDVRLDGDLEYKLFCVIGGMIKFYSICARFDLRVYLFY